MKKLNKDDLEDLQYYSDCLKSISLDSLLNGNDNSKDALYLTKAIVEVVTGDYLYINNTDYINSLKTEIRTQRKEIAALREERRMLLDKDFPPNREV